MNKSPWRKQFNEIRLSCKNESELNKRIQDMETRGFKLLNRYVNTKRGAATSYEKHIAKMRRV